MPATATTSHHRMSMVRALIGALFVGVGILIGLVVTHVGASHTGELDLDISLSHHRLSGLVAIADVIKIGIGPILGPVLIVCVALGLSRKNRTAALVFAGTALSCWMASDAFKPLFARLRPPTVQVHALVREPLPNSFPSGHTALSMGVVWGVFFAARIMGHSGLRVLLVGLPLTVLVAASRLYLGAHYLGDVVASYFFAGGCAMWLWAAAPIARRRVRAHRMESQKH